MAQALVFCDGFDKYGPPANQNLSTVMNGDFTLTAGLGVNIVAGLSSPGYAMQVSGTAVGTTTVLQAVLPVSLTRVVGSYRFQGVSSNAQLSGVRFSNSGTAAFTLVYNHSVPRIELHTGTEGGTLLTSGGSPAVGTTHVLSFDITIGASSAYAVYLDGVALFSGTGNTGNGQSSVNQTSAISTAAANVLNTWIIDDFCVYDPSNGNYNSAVLTSNVIVETSIETSDSQTQFTNDGDVVFAAGTTYGNGVYHGTASTNAPGAGQLFLVKVTPDISRTINSVSVVPGATSVSAKFKATIYADSAGSPGSLLSSGTEVVGCTSGVTLTGALVTPQSITASTSYWIGFITDTSVVLQEYDASAQAIKKANTYASGAPSPAGGSFTTGQATWLIWGNCTGSAANWAAVNRNPPLGTSAAQIHDSTVGHEDLYNFPSVVNSTIYGVNVKGFVSKSDSGARTVSFNTKSVASDSTGANPGQAMSTTPQWQSSVFDTDPATGSAWTASGLNAAKSGVSVAS